MGNAGSNRSVLRRLAWNTFGAFMLAGVASAATAADTTPPTAPGNTTSPNCTSILGDACHVPNADFTVRVTAATDTGGSGLNPSGYQVCRSNDTTGWGGCNVSMTLTSTVSFVVTGTHRPAPGVRRAFYFRARDNAGNWGPWNNPIYIVTATADTTPPSAPGPSTSAQCVSIQNGTCFVNPGNFTVSVTAATDNAGGSGVNPNGYNICRSVDTAGWGGCDVTITNAGTTSTLVSGAHLPAPGQRRAYYVRAKDNAGTYGAWNTPLFVQTIADTTAPGGVPNAVGRVNGASIAGLTVNTANPTIALTWSPATDNVAVTSYNIVLQEAVVGTWLHAPSVAAPATSYSLATANLLNGKQYHVWIRALDAAGNASAFGLVGTFSVALSDTTPPSAVPSLSARIGGMPINGLVVGNDNPTVAVSWGLASDNVAVSRYQVLLVNNGTGANTYNVSVNHPGTSTSIATTNLANNQSYSLQARAIDTNGNLGPLANAGSFTVRLDTTPPTPVGSFGARLNGRDIAGQQVPWSNPQVDLAWTAATDASGIKKYAVTLERTDVAGIAATQILSGTATASTFGASGLVVNGTYRFAIKAQDNKDNWGPVVQTGSFGISPALSSAVQPHVELLVSALPVVEDAVRTTGCGAWTFCAMMTSLAGTQDPADFTERFFDLFNVRQTIGEDVVEPMPHVPSMIFPSWPRVGGKLDLANSPFKLLAIVNRADLVRPGDAGEARMVYGFSTSSGDRFTLILEYRMSTSTLTRAQWWTEWHRLTQNPDSRSEAYRNQLQFLTDSFARTPVDGKIPLGQLRINDGLAFRIGLFWHFREFMQPSANASLVQTTVKQTPRQVFQQTTLLGDWINANEAQILEETHEVAWPLALGGLDLLNGFFIPSNVRNKFAGMVFSKNTCSGCHIANNQVANVGAPLFQIAPRKAGHESKLADFFFNVQLCGGFDETNPCLFPYTQNELGRRKSIFEQDLGIVGFSHADPEKAGESAELPLHEPADEDVVTLDSLSRVH